MTLATKKGPLGPRCLVGSAKKRGRSIASVTVSFAVPIAAGLRWIGIGTSLPSVPFDPDVGSVVPLSQRAASPVVAVRSKGEKRGDEGELDRRVRCQIGKPHEKGEGQKIAHGKAVVRASARHIKPPVFVENSETRRMRSVCSGSELSNPTASYQPVNSILSHLCLRLSTRIVTELRQRTAMP